MGGGTNLPSSALWRLQRVLHASARLVYGSSHYDHVTPLLRELQWLPIQARIEVRVGTLAFLCINGLAPTYLASELSKVTTLPGRTRLRSATAGSLIVPQIRHPTFGGRTFAAVAARLWNRLPSSLTSVNKVSAFKKAFKRFLLECL